MSAAPAIGAEYDAALVSSRYRCLVEQLGEAVDHRRGWKARAAEVLGVTPGYVSKVLGGVATTVTEPTMRKACDALDLGPEFFLAAEPERVPRDVAERALAAVEPEPTVTIPAARYAEMLRNVDELTESRDHAVSTGLDALDRVRELEELLRAGTSKARAIAVLRAEGIEPVPADEVRAMREAVRERDRLAARVDAVEGSYDAERWVDQMLQAADVDLDGDEVSPDDVVEALHEKWREAAAISDAATSADIRRITEELHAWRLSNVPRLLGIADDQLAKVRAVLGVLDRYWGATTSQPSVADVRRAVDAWRAAGRPLVEDLDATMREVRGG